MRAHTELVDALSVDIRSLTRTRRNRLGISVRFITDDNTGWVVVRMVFQWTKERGEISGSEWHFLLDRSVSHYHWKSGEADVSVIGHEEGFLFDPYSVCTSNDFLYDDGPDDLIDVLEILLRRCLRKEGLSVPCLYRTS